MFAIVETGGKQYKVKPGDRLQVERLDGEPGSTVELDRVLMVADGDDLQVGSPLLAGVKVVAEVVSQDKGRKIVVLKYKRKVRYRRKTGHRQRLTTLRIADIHGG